MKSKQAVLSLPICLFLGAAQVSADVCMTNSDGVMMRIGYQPLGSGSYILAGTLVESDGLRSAITGSLAETSFGLVGTLTHSGASGSNYWTEIDYVEWNRSNPGVVAVKLIGHEKIDSTPYTWEALLTIVACP